MKKFLENLKAEWMLLGSQILGSLFLVTMFLVYDDFGYLLGSCCFGILFVSSILAIWLSADKKSRK